MLIIVCFFFLKCSTFSKVLFILSYLCFCFKFIHLVIFHLGKFPKMCSSTLAICLYFTWYSPISIFGCLFSGVVQFSQRRMLLHPSLKVINLSVSFIETRKKKRAQMSQFCKQHPTFLGSWSWK